MRRNFLASKMAIFITSLAFVVISVACGSSAQKGDETPMPAVDGKSDTWWAPTVHGDLRFGESDQGLFDGEMKFHAWDFELAEGSAGSAVVLTTTAIDPNVDTVMYLYHWNPAAKSWGKYLARNDDHDGKIGSQISKKLEGGLYRAVVKGYKDKVRGSFAMTGSCEGTGCPAASSANSLSSKEEAAIVSGLDAICGDTYCAGDYNWWTVSANCVYGAGCTMAFDVQSYYPEESFPKVWLDRFTADQLQGVGTFSSGKGAFAVSLDRMVDRASDGVWVRASCEMGVPYSGYSDLMGSGASPALNPGFEDDVMDCVAGIEGLMLNILPSNFAP